MKELTISELFELKKRDYVLTLLTESKTLENKLTESHVNRPGLALTGYTERFSAKRVQILGETEISYLQTLKSDVLYDRIKELFSYNIPCIIVSKGLSIPSQVEYLANEMNIAVFSSRLSTTQLVTDLNRFLQDYFAPEQTIHGTLIDVFGIGILLTGKSGIGKSECALELIERGHQLITDDAVRLRLRDNLLFGSSQMNFGHFMEIRGVGIIDVERMFGIEAIRNEKRIHTQVELMSWHENMDYERIGLTNNFSEILGVSIPLTYLPVSPGKNVAVIIEVVAMNYILKSYGYDAAEVYTRKLSEEISRKHRNRQ